MTNTFPSMTHPKPTCRFGRQHSWTVFPHIPEHTACGVCGVEDDEAWWDESGRGYIGPADASFVNLNEGGWALRKPEASR